MTKYFDSHLSPDVVETYQGYSLQVFLSGRIKLSFHVTRKDRLEYYAVRPNRFREAYTNQRQRSSTCYPEHFALVEPILESTPDTLIYRVHLKGDNNATVDHAHVLIDIGAKTCHVVLNTLHHAWVLPPRVLEALHLREGPRTGTASVFNEYMASYEHDWKGMTFVPAHYQVGCRTRPNPRADETKF